MRIQNYQMAVNYNPVLFKTILRSLKPKKKDRILDIGCSRGFYVKEMEKYSEGVLGVDVDRVALNEAVTDNIKFDDATNLSFKNDTFDKIYSLHTVEHLPRPTEFFQEISRVLKTQGTAVIVYPFELIRGSQCVVSASRIFKDPLMSLKMHLHKVTPKKIKEFIKDTSLRHIKSRLVFTFFPLSWQYLTILKKS